jgi:hypothetical protein
MLNAALALDAVSTASVKRASLAPFWVLPHGSLCAVMASGLPTTQNAARLKT